MEDKQIVELYFARAESAVAETEKKYGRYLHYIAYRILENQKDDAKEAYRTEHPLPDSLIPEDPEGDTSAPGEESSEESVEESTAESMTESQEEVILTPVENAFRIVSMVLLFGGLALFPVYYVLNNRRRKIIRSFDEPKEPTEGGESEE